MRSPTGGYRAAASAIMLAAGMASTAEAITIRLDDVTPRETVSISSNGGADYHNYLAGLDNFTGSPGNPLFLEGPFTGFCVDFSQSISFGHTYTDYSLVPLEQAGTPAMGAAAAGLISELWGRHFSTLVTSTEYAAFQCSIWEILYDANVSLSGGSFRMASGDVRTLAQTWVNELDGSPAFQAPGLIAIRSPTSQDMIIPTPGSAVLVVGGMGVAMIRRKRK